MIPATRPVVWISHKDGARWLLLRQVARPIAQHAVEVFPHDTVAVHSDLAASVDALLAGRTPVADLREINRGACVLYAGTRGLIPTH